LKTHDSTLMVSSMVKLELQSFQWRLMVHDGKLATTTSSLISIFVWFAMINLLLLPPVLYQFLFIFLYLGLVDLTLEIVFRSSL
jgi:hypothetical protein